MMFSSRLLRRLFSSIPSGMITTSLASSPVYKSIFTPELEKLVSIFRQHGLNIRVAGGAVRDILQSKLPHDLDFATPATPEKVKQVMEMEGIRMINEIGEKHGTVTVRINDKANFEITTLRLDVTTDGRHAEVEYTTEWHVDASRRDLTINAMFLDLQDGCVYDYFDGIRDIKNHKIKFVGDPSKRIREDFLRILRFFRFSGRICGNNWTASDTENVDLSDTLVAIRQNASGLKDISGERIWNEWKLILCGKCWGPLTLSMLQCGIGPYIGISSNANLERFSNLYARHDVISVNSLEPSIKLAALLDDLDDYWDLHARLKMSNWERDSALFAIVNRDKLSSGGDEAIFQTCKFLLADAPQEKVVDTRIWLDQTLRLVDQTDLAVRFSEWSLPAFQISGKDILDAGCAKIRLISSIINKLKQFWKQSDFKADREELLSQINTAIDQVSFDAASNKSESNAIYYSNKRRVHNKQLRKLKARMN